MGFTDSSNFKEKILVIGRVGTHGVVQRISHDCWASDNTLVIKSDFYEYVYHILQRIDYAALNRGSTQPLITQTDVKNTDILLPNKDILSQFEKLTSTIMLQAEANDVQNQTLSHIRDQILPRIMRGELDVADL